MNIMLKRLNWSINPLDETFDLLNLLIGVGQHVRGLLGPKLEIYATSKGHHHRRLYVFLYLSFGEQIITESEESGQSAPT